MIEKSLKKIIRVNTNNSEDVFVGIKCSNNNVSVNFPLGFRLSNNDEEVLEDIQLLIKTLEDNTDKKESQKTRINNKFENSTEPIQSYMYVIKDYLSNGLYKENEVLYRQNNRGKINWGRTIKTQKPIISGGSLLYLDFITKKNNIKDDNLITTIHKYCVQVSFAKLWWLYLKYNPVKEQIKLNSKLFESVLISKMNSTFNDNVKLLFEHLLAIIRCMSNNDSLDFEYGTYRFEYIWEKMINKTFGIKDKKMYFPNTKWSIGGEKYDNHSLMPDTIIIDQNRIYVIDAKYYKYGKTMNIKSLPGTASITKQIAYGEYIDKEEIFKVMHGKDLKVYNAFVLPYDKSNDKKQSMKYIGYATSSWKNNQKEHEKIHGILLDVKDLMQARGRNSQALKQGMLSLIQEYQ